MDILAALLRWFFGLPPKARLLAAAQITLWAIGWALVDPATGRSIPLSADIRRQLRKQIDDCAICIKLAIFERARDIAGFRPNGPKGALNMLARRAELSARDVSHERLIVRVRDLLDLAERFEELAQRHAARLIRLAEHKQVSAFASAVPPIALEAAPATTACADVGEHLLFAPAPPCVRTSEGTHVRAPPWPVLTSPKPAPQRSEASASGGAGVCAQPSRTR